MKKRLKTITTVVLILAFIVLSGSYVNVNASTPSLKPEREAEKIPGLYYPCNQIMSAVNRNYCINLKSNAKVNGQNIQLYRYDRTTACLWHIDTVKQVRGEALFKIQSVDSGKVLDVKGARVANGTNVQLYQWNGTNAQLWKIKTNKDGSKTFLSALDERYAIDLSHGKSRDGQNIQLYRCNGTRAQKWFVEFRTLDTDTDYKREVQKEHLNKELRAIVQRCRTEKKYFTNLTGKLRYYSSDNTVAVVDKSGIIKAKKRGVVIITVSNGVKKAYLKIKTI